MAIVEEPFSIWRLLGSWRRRPESAGRDEPSDVGQARDAGTGPADPDQGAEDQDLADAASLGDPWILSVFNYTVTRCVREESGGLWVEHLLICNRCIAGDMFSISSFPKIAPDPSPYDGVAPGETIRLPPWSTRCVECGRRTMIVHDLFDGHERDAEGPGGEGRPVLEPTEETAAASVYVSLRYPVDLDGLRDRAAQANVAPADLFEAIHVRGIAPNFETIFEGWHPSASGEKAGGAASDEKA